MMMISAAAAAAAAAGGGGGGGAAGGGGGAAAASVVDLAAATVSILPIRYGDEACDFHQSITSFCVGTYNAGYTLFFSFPSIIICFPLPLVRITVFLCPVPNYIDSICE